MLIRQLVLSFRLASVDEPPHRAEILYLTDVRVLSQLLQRTLVQPRAIRSDLYVSGMVTVDFWLSSKLLSII